MNKGSWAVSVSLLASGALWAQSYLISTVAGGGGLPVTPSLAVSVALPPPAEVAVDASGNVYFGSANFVFKLDGSGILTTGAGTGKSGFSGDGGPDTSARINYPQGVAVDPAGNVYIADTYNRVIRKVTAESGIITTVAGTGASFGYLGDGGPAAQAWLNRPFGVALDSSSNLYIADYGNLVIRKVTNGTISTVAGNNALQPGYSGDGASAILAQLNYPRGVAVDSSGNLYIADTGNSRIREVTNGTITTVAGNGTAGYTGDGITATLAEINRPDGVAVVGGNLYIADTSNSRVRKVASGTITTVAGNGVSGDTGDGGTATSAELSTPAGVAVDGSGNLYIADGQNCRIRKVAGGNIATVAGGAGGGEVGGGFWGYAGDGGPASLAELYQRGSVAVDAAGNLYIADTYNYVIRKVTVGTGVITTVAGTGKYGYSGDAGQATLATMKECYGVAVDTAGSIYIADTGNNVIRKVTVATGVITTVAGNGTAFYSGDGGLATSATLDQPYGVAVDALGQIYIADTGNNVIRGG